MCKFDKAFILSNVDNSSVSSSTDSSSVSSSVNKPIQSTVLYQPPKTIADSSILDFKINIFGVLTKYKGNASEVKIPDYTTKIAKNAFSKCASIEFIIMLDSVKKSVIMHFLNVLLLKLLFFLILLKKLLLGCLNNVLLLNILSFQTA